ncbi:MAG: hypothetical protein AABN33_18400 [Acidobacteriota bacterium]
MKLLFKVVSCEPTKIEREVEVDGAKFTLPVPAIIAQLIPLNDAGAGTIKVPVLADETKMFEVGNTVSVQFSPGE